MIRSILEWLTSADAWSGADGILARLLEHVGYTLLVLVIAAAIAIPVGLWIGHSGRGRWLVTAANALRAVPTLGLLFALTLVLLPRLPGDAAFLVPSVIVLVLLAIPAILSGTYAGVEAVDPAARDAARGIGMTGSQVLWKVELPIALPLLLSGLRAAVLQVVATATVAAYVGLGGLGRFLIDGLATQDYAMTAGGAILVALLALALDAPFALLGRLIVSPGLTGRTRSLRPDTRTITAGGTP
ncbi:ABC transporter permease [Janibacter sp. CX7]|uniref:ABC transporter permease n=1 Tax=Janibacter sp. CX7 TaxID=2963431 RepID=UPI0020CB9084|nr:ABC transporter permease [Janibacter sp. CX7]UTT65718.1 ABC transporter permease [Janibacter sp. CX7]